MKNFSDLGVATPEQKFTGDKININRLLNREIVVHRYEVKDSKFTDKGNGKCLHLQVEVGGEMHVLFSGSGVLMNTITKVPETDFPFKTTIVREDQRLKFT